MGPAEMSTRVLKVTMNRGGSKRILDPLGNRWNDPAGELIDDAQEMVETTEMIVRRSPCCLKVASTSEELSDMAGSAAAVFNS